VKPYQDFEAWYHTQHDTQIKVLHSDCGGEYLSKDFVNHLKAVGTQQKLTVHNTPQHNRIAKRLNCTLLEKVRAMLHDSGLPCMLWGKQSAMLFGYKIIPLPKHLTAEHLLKLLLARSQTFNKFILGDLVSGYMLRMVGSLVGELPKGNGWGLMMGVRTDAEYTSQQGIWSPLNEMCTGIHLIMSCYLTRGRKIMIYLTQ
jgi:hypothetical protein